MVIRSAILGYDPHDLGLIAASGPLPHMAAIAGPTAGQPRSLIALPPLSEEHETVADSLQVVASFGSSVSPAADGSVSQSMAPPSPSKGSTSVARRLQAVAHFKSLVNNRQLEEAADFIQTIPIDASIVDLQYYLEIAIQLKSCPLTAALLSIGADPYRGYTRSYGITLYEYSGSIRFLQIANEPYKLAVVNEQKEIFLLLYAAMGVEQKTRVQKLYAQNEKVTAWIEEYTHNTTSPPTARPQPTFVVQNPPLQSPRIAAGRLEFTRTTIAAPANRFGSNGDDTDVPIISTEVLENTHFFEDLIERGKLEEAANFIRKNVSGILINKQKYLEIAIQLKSCPLTAALLSIGADPCREYTRPCEYDGMAISFLQIDNKPYQLAVLHKQKDIFLLLYAAMGVEQKKATLEFYLKESNAAVMDWIFEYEINIRQNFRQIAEEHSAKEYFAEGCFAEGQIGGIVYSFVRGDYNHKEHLTSMLSSTSSTLAPEIKAKCDIQLTQLEEALAQPATSPEQHLR
jgi:hypothetical protein